MTHTQAIETMAAERYLLDEMSEIERFRFEEHFFDCEECAETMRLGHRLRTDAKHIFVAAPASAAERRVESVPVARPAWRPSLRVALPWAAAAVLAVGLLYDRNQGTSGLQDVRALSPAVLRPASRGPIVSVPLPDAGEVALALDVNMGAAGEPIAYRLTRDDGAEIDAGRATVPAAGSPLVLLVPGDRLEPGGQFLLALTTPGDPAAPPSEYRFNVTAR
jgi:Putative zinc-finger